MQPEPNHAKSIFLQAIEGELPENWEAFLDNACAGDAALQSRVADLLRAHREMGSFHEAAAVATLVVPPISEEPGMQIGPYKLLEQIGEGGFGVVFMAEQTQPVRRKVALKVLKPGMDTKQVVARFEAERQALAIMDHPHIAKVHDGGATPSGRPFFVMELVKGVPITEYCDQNHLPPRQRLELFVPVCEAIQHAHQKGIIHRDLKPSNVLVCVHDTRPVVKVIDFGVAKALGQELTDRTLFTGFAQMIGTPLYMSPEQAGQSSLDVDTRSDIYSLGVVLYELLTGTTPFDRERFKEASYEEIRRIIREDEPARPSHRISTLAARACSTVAECRQSDPRRLSRLFRGELDWIVMKALEKDRNRRYDTASAFALDVQRYLADEPVLACPPSASYRLRKFARRNKGILATAVALLLALVGLAVSIVLIDRERQQALTQWDKAEASFRDACQAVEEQFTLVSQSTLFEAPGLQELRKDLLEGSLKHYQKLLADRGDDPTLRAEIAAVYLRLYQIYEVLDSKDESLLALERSLDIIERLLQEDPHDAPLYQRLAGFSRGGRYVRGSFQQRQYSSPAAALHALQKAAALWDQFVRANPSQAGFKTDLAAFYIAVGNVHSRERRLTESLSEMQKAHALRFEQAQENPSMPEYRAELAWTFDMVGELLHSAGRLPEAEDHFRHALELREKLLVECPGVPEYQRAIAHSYSGCAGRLLSLPDRLLEAERACRQALEHLEKLAGEFPAAEVYRAELANNRILLGNIFRGTGRAEEAAAAYGEALQLFAKLAADSSQDPYYRQQVVHTQHDLGFLAWDCARRQDGEPCVRKTLRIFEQLAAEAPGVLEHRLHLADTCCCLAGVLAANYRPEEADKAYLRAVEIHEKMEKDFGGRTEALPNLARRHFQTARLLREAGRLNDAEKLYRLVLSGGDRLAAESRDEPAGRQQLAHCYDQLHRILMAKGQFDDADQVFNECLDVWKKLAADHPVESELAFKNLGVPSQIVVALFAEFSV